MAAPFCPMCGKPQDGGEHPECAGRADLDPPRYCRSCGRTLDVQVQPTRFTATCRRCDGVHPARR